MFKIEQQPQGQQIFFHYLKACLLNYVIHIYDKFFETGFPSAEWFLLLAFSYIAL